MGEGLKSMGLSFFSCFYDTIFWARQIDEKKMFLYPKSQSTMVWRSRQQKFEAPGNYYIMVRRRAINRCTHEHTQPTFPFLKFVILCLRNHSQWTEFLTLINLMKIIHHRHSHTPISQVILGFKLTNLTVTISPVSAWHLNSSFLKHSLSTSDSTCSGPS